MVSQLSCLSIVESEQVDIVNGKLECGRRTRAAVGSQRLTA
jgi:hypothetical protein